jgi:hypothetical protein
MNIGQWLADLGLSQYEAAFRSNDVDVEVLGELTGMIWKTSGFVTGARGGMCGKLQN